MVFLKKESAFHSVPFFADDVHRYNFNWLIITIITQLLQSFDDGKLSSVKNVLFFMVVRIITFSKFDFLFLPNFLITEVMHKIFHG